MPPFSVEFAWDEVDEVGTFVELETSADDAHLDAARTTLLDLARQLQLDQPERRSYLEMLFAARASRTMERS